MMKVYILFLLAIISFNACRKADIDAIDNLNGGKIDIIGHAGSGFQTGRNPTPTNSESSIKIAIEGYGADGCEVDLQLSKDSIPILFHDALLDGSTSCTGCIYENNSDELLQCSFRNDFAVNIFNSENIISLNHILNKYITSDFHPMFYLDIKLYDECNTKDSVYIRTLSVQLINTIHGYNSEDRIFIITDSQKLINLIRALDSNPKSLLFIGGLNKTFREEMQFALINNLHGFTIGNSEISAAEVKEAHDNNLRVILHNVKSRNSAVEAVEKFPDVILTDNIQMLQEVLR
jgi:glycerophosphoryl diester phosphodiesterase